MSGGGKVDMGQFGAVEFQTNAAASVYSKGPFINVSSAKQHQRKRGSGDGNKTSAVNFMPAHSKSPSETQPLSGAYRVLPAKKREMSTLPIFKLLRSFNLQQYTRVSNQNINFMKFV